MIISLYDESRAAVEVSGGSDGAQAAHARSVSDTLSPRSRFTHANLTASTAPRNPHDP